MNTKLKSVMVPLHNTQSTKAEEVATLKKLVVKIPDTSYLGKMFTPDLLDWFEAQVRNDWDTDLFNHFEYERDQKNSWALELSETRSILKKEEAKHAKELEEVKAELARVIVERDDFHQQSVKTSQAYLDSENRSWKAKRAAQNTHRLLRRALGRFRRIASDREAKWEFTVDQLKR